MKSCRVSWVEHVHAELGTVGGADQPLNEVGTDFWSARCDLQRQRSRLSHTSPTIQVAPVPDDHNNLLSQLISRLRPPQTARMQSLRPAPTRQRLHRQGVSRTGARAQTSVHWAIVHDIDRAPQLISPVALA